MIKFSEYIVSKEAGRQFVFENTETGKTLYLMAAIDVDIEKFKEQNMPIAELETEANNGK